MEKVRKIDLFILILVAFVLLNGLLWAFTVPFNGAPDEYDHFRLSAFISEHSRIPIFGQDQNFYYASIFTKFPIDEKFVAADKMNPQIPSNAFLYELKPVYMMWPCGPYFLFALFLKIAAFFKVTQGFYFARLVSVLCGGLIVFFLYDFTKKLFPDDKYLPKMVALFVGFLPQFTFLSAYINPDIVTALVTTLLFWTWFVCLEEKFSSKSAILFGVLLGLLILCKISGYSAGLMSLMFLFFLKSQKRLKWWLTVFGFCFLSAGWFFIRNQVVYGDWSGYATYTKGLMQFLGQTPAFVAQHDVFRFLSLMQYDIKAVPYLLNFCFESFWGTFGWATIKLPKFYYLAAYGLTALSLIGVIKVLIARPKDILKNRVFFWLAITLPLQALVIFIYIAMIKYQPQGRYLIAIILPVAVVFCYGLLNLSKNEQAKFLIFLGIGTFFVFFNLYSFFYCNALGYARF